jgi:hypothetical protein
VKVKVRVKGVGKGDGVDGRRKGNEGVGKVKVKVRVKGGGRAYFVPRGGILKGAAGAAKGGLGNGRRRAEKWEWGNEGGRGG